MYVYFESDSSVEGTGFDLLIQPSVTSKFIYSIILHYQEFKNLVLMLFSSNWLIFPTEISLNKVTKHKSKECIDSSSK